MNPLGFPCRRKRSYVARQSRELVESTTPRYHISLRRHCSLEMINDQIKHQRQRLRLLEPYVLANLGKQAEIVSLTTLIEPRFLKAYGLAYASVVGPRLLKLLLSLRRQTHGNRRENLSAVSAWRFSIVSHCVSLLCLGFDRQPGCLPEFDFQVKIC